MPARILPETGLQAITLVVVALSCSRAQPISVPDTGMHIRSFSSFSNVTPAGDVFYFTLNEDLHGLELWRSDGTTSGTYMVKDIAPDFQSSSPDHLLSADGLLYFTATDGIHGRCRWRSDGTTEGTRMVKATENAVVPSLFYTDTASFEYKGEVQHSDASAALSFLEEARTAGTEVTSALRVDHSYSGPIVRHTTTPVYVDGVRYFVAEDDRGEELWRSDGTLMGTKLVKDILPGPYSSRISQLTVLNDLLYFSAYDGKHGSELWRSDGTGSGTFILKDIVAGGRSSHPRNFTSFKGAVYFSVFGEEGVELWKTDGREQGTVRIFPAEAGLDRYGYTNPEDIADSFQPFDRHIRGNAPETVNVSVFPNPFTDKLRLRIDAPTPEAVTVALMDTHNNRIFQSTGEANTTIEIDRTLTQGIYLLRVSYGSSLRIVKVAKVN